MTDKKSKTVRLSFIDVWAIAFGCIVGWGAFVMPGTTFLPIAGPIGTVIAMAVGTVLMLVIGRNYSYLMAKFPGEGGVYSYTKEAFGRHNAFLCSWFLSLSYLTVVFLNAIALFLVARTMFGKLFQFGFRYKVVGYNIYFGEILISVFALVVIGLIFILKRSILRWVQTALALIMIVGVLVITVAAFLNYEPNDFFPEFGTGGTGSAIVGIITIILLSPWAFVGFDIASLETSRFSFSVKKSKRLITLSILCGAFVYTALALVSATARPNGFTMWADYFEKLDEMSGTTAVPTVYAAQSAMGNIGLILVGIVASAAILTGIIAAYRATANMLSAMARDNILNQGFLKSTFCIVFIMLISIAFSFFGGNALDWFVHMTSFGAVIGFGYASAAAWKFAAKEKNRQVQVTGFIGTGISFIFTIAHLVSKVTDVETMCSESFLLLAIWCLLGFVFFWRTMRKSELPDFKGVAVTTSVLFCLVMYSAIVWFVKSLPEMDSSAEATSIITLNAIVLFAFAVVGVVVMLYIQDALRRRHNKLEREKIHAEESSKAKSRFLFSISHDIRTPMNAILGYTHLIKQEENLLQPVSDYVNKIDTSGKHLMALIDNILEMSRIEYGKLELNPCKASLRDTVRDAYDMLKPSMDEKKITYELNDEKLGGEWTVFDKNYFVRVMLNFLSNAYKFTPEGGRVLITAESVINRGYVDYEIHVKDNGIGMTKEFAKTVFEAFARERTSTVSHIQGTGLGMTISKSIVEEMGGTIELYTEPDKGTEFVIKLNFELCEPPKTDENVTETQGKNVDFSNKKLLLAEDMEVNRKIVQIMLENIGFTITSVENGKAAVEKLNATGGAFDAVLMDIQMPIMNGYDAAKTIRQSNNPRIVDIPIIAVTANASYEDIKRAEEAGINRCISKPIDPEQLKNLLAEMFAD